MSRLSSYLVIFALWVILSVGSVLAGLLAPFFFMLYPFFRNGGWIRNVAEAHDRTAAAMWFGWNGRRTISLECAYEERLNRNRKRRQVALLVRGALNKADPRHVPQSVFEAHDYCELEEKEDWKNGS